jgi:nucleoside-diphosphate-sugar epimerase
LRREKRMHVWVSGARGKLGAEVCRQLVASAHLVTEADITAGADAVDLLDRHAVARSLRGADAIIHWAGIPSPTGIAAADLVQTNTMSTFNALEEGWKAGIRTAVLASSGSIYGTAWSPERVDPPYLPVDEDSPLQYVDPYALTKDFLERMGQMYARRGMNVISLRFQWILTQAEVRESVNSVPFDEGARNLWGYVDLEDAARACLLALRPREGQARYRTLLIAASDTRVERPVEDLIAEYCPDSEIRIPLRGPAGGFDCSRAWRVIGWRPHAKWRDTE